MTSTERRALEKRIEDEKRHFAQKMMPDDCKRFEELEGLCHAAGRDEKVDIYSRGFTLGALLMMEVFAKKIINK